MAIKTSSKLKLGIFISLGIAIFIFAIYFIGEKQQLFRTTFRISAEFKDVGGLQAGNNVRLSGINVGIVENVSIVSDTSVKVIILIDDNTREFIKKDAVASIGSEGLMGNKVLIISPGTGGLQKIENNDIISSTQPIDIDEIMESLKTTIDNTSSITGDLAKIATNIESGNGTIGRLMMDKSWRQNIEATIVNLKEGSDEFKVWMSKSSLIDSLLMAMSHTIENTATITGDLAKITNSLQSGEGTIGRLLMNTSSAQNFDSTMTNLKDGSAELKLLLQKAQDSWLLGGF